MKMTARIKPVSYLETHASEIVRTLGDQDDLLIITQDGKAKAVLQDIDSYEQTRRTIALLRILALGGRQIEAGEVEPARDVIARFREPQRSS